MVHIDHYMCINTWDTICLRILAVALVGQFEWMTENLCLFDVLVSWVPLRGKHNWTKSEGKEFKKRRLNTTPTTCGLLLPFFPSLASFDLFFPFYFK